MSKSKQSGQLGEQLAADYLKQNGWEILEMNFRHKRAEIDIIACDGKILLFVEVKSRSNTNFGEPEAFVDHRKAELILTAAESYIIKANWMGRIRFDIIAVHNNGKGGISHFEDAFY